MKIRERKNKIDCTHAGRVLVIRLDEIGDLILTIPFLRELRRHLPRAFITLVVKPATYNLVEFCPYVDEVLTFDWGRPGYLHFGARLWKAIFFARTRLLPRHFDIVVMPRWDADYYCARVMAFLCGAPIRAGYSETVARGKNAINAWRDRLLTEVIYDSRLRHEVERGLDMVKYLGGEVKDEKLELWLSKEDQLFATQALVPPDFGGVPAFVCFGLGAGNAKRRWPIERFIEVGSSVMETYGVTIVLLGDGTEMYLGKRFKEALGTKAIDLIGKTTLRQAAAILSRCRCYVGTDSGILHIASAMGIPVVEISCHPVQGNRMHENSPARFGPWKVMSRVVQPQRALLPCTDACRAKKPHCITEVNPIQVISAVRDILA